MTGVRKQFSPPKRQSGLVMLMVVGVVVLMIVLLALLLEDQHRMIRQIGNQRVAEQAYHYSQGLNAWALRVLHNDKNPLSDHEKETWAEFGRPKEDSEAQTDGFSLDSSLPLGQSDEEEATIDFGIDTIEVTINDLQSRFNLNNLTSPKKDQSPPQSAKRIFLNLLQVLEIGEYQEDREQLYWNLVDWMDENDTSAGFGAESGDYQIRSKPYFASDQPLSSVGELRYVKGFSKEVVSKLSPFVVVLPVKNAKINLNTASKEVLSSLAGGPVVDASQIDSLLARKEQPGFQGFNQGDIQGAQTMLNGVSPGQNSIENMLQVTSQFYQINTKVELGDHKVCTRTTVLRPSVNDSKLKDSESTISVLSREQDTICKDNVGNSEQEEPINNEDLS